MERKNYLTEKLSKEEKAYLTKMIVNYRNNYIRDNYAHINNVNIELNDSIVSNDESIIDVVIRNCEEKIKSAIEFEKLMSNPVLYNVVEALSLNEKIVLFSLFKENKPVQEIMKEFKMGRTSVWRYKNDALEKIAKALLGGTKNV